MSELVTVYHGTAASRAKSIRDQGLAPGPRGTFLTTTEWIGWRYSRKRTCVELVHDGGPNLGVLVIAEVDRDQLTRLPKEPPPGHAPCVGYTDGWRSKDGVPPEAIIDMRFAEFAALKTWRGIWQVYRNFVALTPETGVWADGGNGAKGLGPEVFARSVAVRKRPLTKREKKALEMFAALEAEFRSTDAPAIAVNS